MTLGAALRWTVARLALCAWERWARDPFDVLADTMAFIAIVVLLMWATPPVRTLIMRDVITDFTAAVRRGARPRPPARLARALLVPPPVIDWRS